MKLLIDGDIVVMRAAHAAFTKKSGDMGAKHSFLCAKNIMNAIFNDCDFDEYIMYIGTPGDKTQHRYRIFPAYKANRINVPKPKYFEYVRNYLLKYYITETVIGIEVDDKLSIEQNKNNVPDYRSTICTIDKDLDIVPGFHYNPVKKQRYFQSELAALKCLYKQILVGDTSDGIPRIFAKVKLTDWCREIDELQTEKDMLDRVRECIYTVFVENCGIEMSQEEIDKEILWRGQILCPLRFEGDLWNIDHLT